MQQYFCMCTARIWDRWLILTFGALGCCLLFGLGSFLFFRFPCSIARSFSFIYLFISHYSQLIHALVLSVVSFFLPLFPCPVFFPLFIYLFHIIPNSYMPLYSLQFLFFFPSSLVGCFFLYLFIYHYSPTHTCPCTLSTFHSSIGVQIVHALTIIMSVAFFQLLNLCLVHGP